MASPLVTAMTGPYKAEYAPPSGRPGYTTPEAESGYGAYLNIGETANAKVYEVSGEFEEIVSDYWGSNTLLNGVVQGFRHVLNLEPAEWSANVRHMLFPWGGTNASPDIGRMPAAGQLLSSAAGILKLTALAGPATGTLGPATFIAKIAIVSPRTNLRMAMGSTWRRMPAQMLLLPYYDGTNYRTHEVT